MATPITHIVLTDKVYDKHFSHLNKKEFFVGTSFPDIRYLGVIDREKTHFTNLSLEEIKEETPFIAGVKFHSFLDEVREKFVVSRDLYSEIPESLYITQELKFLEDRTLYDKITSWKEYSSYFEDILDEALTLGVSRNDVSRWNRLLVEYFSVKPDEGSVTKFVQGIGKPVEMSQEINRVVEEIGENEKVLSAIEDLYVKFEELLL